MKWRLMKGQREKELPGVAAMGWGDGKKIAGTVREEIPVGIRNGENL
jgi:hypothetical protein